MTKAYEVRKSNYDAARPFAVVATFRSFNQVIERYADEDAANRRARRLNRQHEPRETNEDRRFHLREA
jgi:hypothetical protein